MESLEIQFRFYEIDRRVLLASLWLISSYLKSSKAAVDIVIGDVDGCC